MPVTQDPPDTIDLAPPDTIDLVPPDVIELDTRKRKPHTGITPPSSHAKGQQLTSEGSQATPESPKSPSLQPTQVPSLAPPRPLVSSSPLPGNFSGLEVLPSGAISPLPPPPMPKAPIPSGLQGPPSPVGNRPEFPPAQLPSRPLPGFRGVPAAGQEVVQGLGEIVRGLPPAYEPGMPPPYDPRTQMPPSPSPPPGESSTLALRGAHHVIEGATKAAAPVVLPAMAIAAAAGGPAAAIPIVGGLVAGTAAQEGVQWGGKKLGLNEDITNLASDVAAFGPIHKIPAYRSAVEGMVEAFTPEAQSAAKQLARGLRGNVAEMQAIDRELAAPGLQPERHSDLVARQRQLGAETTLGLAALNRANAYGRVEAARIAPNLPPNWMREQDMGFLETKAPPIPGVQEAPKPQAQGTQGQEGLIEGMTARAIPEGQGGAGPEGHAYPIPEDFPTTRPEVPTPEVPKAPGEVLAPEVEAVRPALGEAKAPEDAGPKFSITITPHEQLDLHSKLAEVVEQKMPARVTAQQALGIIRNSGIKAEELAWTDIERDIEALGESYGGKPIPKQAIQDFVEASIPQLQEKALGEPTDAAVLRANRLRREWRQAKARLDTYDFLENPDPARREADRLQEEALRVKAEWAEEQARPHTKYSQENLQTPGGSNYREFIISMPQMGGPYKSPHWGSEPNVVAHYRTTDRQGPNGEKIRHVEEIQADWAQQGRKKGYREGPIPEEVPFREDDFDRLDKLLARENYLGYSDAHAARMAIRSDPAELARAGNPELVRLGEAYRAHHASLTAIREAQAKIPPTPYPSTPGWAGLALKRILRRAAEEGYDAVTWTTGETQNARYNLQAIVDELTWDKESHLLRGSKDGYVRVEEKISPEKLPDYVGKDVAQRLMDRGEAAGSDLAVGGEGMRGFYDKILPSVVKKLTKQTPTLQFIGHLDNGQPLEAWRLDLTPELKAQVLKPQPLFSVKQESAALAAPMMDAKTLASRLPKGHELRLLPNNEALNPKGATFGIRIPATNAWLKLRISPQPHLEVSPEALAGQLGRPAAQGEVAVGSYESLGLGEQSVIALAGGATPGDVDHELFHYAFDKLLSPKEQKQLIAKFGSEEAAATAFGLQPDLPALGPLRKRATRIRDAFWPDAQRTLDSLKRGEAWERQMRHGADLRTVRMVDPVTGKVTWSLAGLARSFAEVFDRGAVRLESNPKLYAAAAAAAPGTSTSIAREATWQAAPKIAREMQKLGYGKTLADAWRVFAEVLIDSRLAGAKNRWIELAQATLEAKPEELAAQLAKGDLGPDAPLLRVVQRIDAAQPGRVDPNVREHRVLEFLANGDVEGARTYLTHLFMHNHGAIKRLPLKATYGKTLQEFAADPSFQQALQIYKSELEAPFMRHHAKNEGFLSADLGPLDTYYPLVPLTEDLGWRGVARQRGYLIRPHNPANYFTLGLSKAYDPSLATMRQRLISSIRGGNQAEFLGVLRDSGLAVRVGSPDVTTAKFRGGEEWPVEVIALGSAQSLRLKGQTFKVPPQYIAVPKPLARVVKGVALGEGPLGTSAYYASGGRWQDVEDVANLIVGWSLLGPSDAAFHAQAVLAGLSAGTPYIPGSTAWRSFVKNMPVVKSLAGMYEIMKKPASWYEGGQGAKVLQEMTPWGVLSPRAGGVAADREMAELMGAEWRPAIWNREGWKRTPEEAARGAKGLWGFPAVAGRLVDMGTSSAVFGHAGVDTRARVALWEMHKTLFPDASPVDRALFTNQAMQYNYGLQGALEQYIKGNPLTRLTSTFYTAASSNIRFGIRSLNPLGSSYGMDRGANSLFLRRTQHALTSSILGYTAFWALANYAHSLAAGEGGKWPWDSKDPVAYGSIKISDGRNKSAFLKLVTGDNRDPVYVDMGFLNPRVWTGSRPIRAWEQEAQALRGVTNPEMAELARYQAQQEGIRAGLNLLSHPFTSGPVTRMAFATMGASPWLGRFTDARSGAPSFPLRMDPVASRNLAEAAVRTGQRVVNQMSPSAQFLAEQGTAIGTGTPWSGPEYPGDPATVFRTINDLLIPRSRISRVNVSRAEASAIKRLAARAGYLARQEARKRQAKRD